MRVQLMVFKWNTWLDNFPRCLPFPQLYNSENFVIQNSERDSCLVYLVTSGNFFLMQAAILSISDC